MGENILGSDLFKNVKEKERKREQNEADKKQRKQEQEDNIKQKVADVQARLLSWMHGTQENSRQWWSGLNHQATSNFQQQKVKLLLHYFLTCGRIKTERNWLKEGEVAVVNSEGIDDEDAEDQWLLFVCGAMCWLCACFCTMSYSAFLGSGGLLTSAAVSSIR